MRSIHSLMVNMWCIAAISAAVAFLLFTQFYVGTLIAKSMSSSIKGSEISPQGPMHDVNKNNTSIQIDRNTTGVYPPQETFERMVEHDDGSERHRKKNGESEDKLNIVLLHVNQNNTSIQVDRNTSSVSPRQETVEKMVEHDDESARRRKKNGKSEEKLNIVLLYADDWGHGVLGSAGNPVVQTPVLDRLAEQGIRFTHNCVTTSICWISRATLVTGQYMSRHKTQRLFHTHFYSYWNETYPGLLRENGYHIGHVGKWHIHDFPAEKFDFANEYYGVHYEQRKSKKVHVTKLNEIDSLEFLRTRPKDKPFYLTVAFFATHAEDGNPEQYLPQKESMSLYANTSIPISLNATEKSWKRLPSFFTEQNEGRRRWHWRHDSQEKHEKMMRNFYRMATEVDTACGNIIEELERKGVLNDTLVIFTTDNGLFQGQHGLADKWYPHEESLRVPLIIRDPRMPKKKIGQLNDKFTLNIDLAPTILSAAGINPPERMQGRDIAPLYIDNASGEEWRKEFFYEHPEHLSKDDIPASEALVRKDFKYFLWPDHDVEQLFDMNADPYEENDLIQDPSYKDLLTEMRKRFSELKAAAL